MLSKKWGSKILAGLMAVTMVTAFTPEKSLADNVQSESMSADSTPVALSNNDNVSGLELRKTAKLEDDGTYTINMEAWATGELKITEEKVPLDIVLVLDQSGSMADPFEYGVEETYGQFTGTYWESYSTPVYHLCTDGQYHELNVTREWKTVGYKYSYDCEYCDQHIGANQCFLAGWRQYPSSDKNWGHLILQKITTSKEITRINALKDAVSSFVDNVRTDAVTNNLDHKIAVVGFASENGYGNNSEILSVAGKNTSISNSDAIGVAYGDLTNTEYKNALVGCSDQIVDKSINALAASGATRADLGMEMAKNILAQNPNTDGSRKQIVIMFTDGVPTSSNTFDNTVANGAIQNAKVIKDGKADVYTIGIFEGADQTTPITDISGNTDTDYANIFMHSVSCNYPNAENMTNPGSLNKLGYYMSATNSEGLSKVFDSIAQGVTGNTKVTLTSEAVLKDIISDDFVAPEDTTVFAQLIPYLGNGQWDTNNPEQISATRSGKTVSVTGFSYKDNYVAEALGEAPATGKKLVVTIQGIEAVDTAATGIPVKTNAAGSGIYENNQAVSPVAEFTSPEVTIPSKTYVLDYAKSAKLDLSDATASHLDSDGMNKFEEKQVSLSKTYGKVSLNDKVVYEPLTMSWNGYDSFYAFGTWNTKPENITTGNNTWTKVSVIPANNVYYEDDFITNNASGTVGIEYTGKWDTDGTSSGNTETANTENHGGWQNTDLANDAKYSDGSAHKTVASNDNVASATFTFTGTGVDVYSRTDMTTGTVYAVLKGTSDDSESITKRLIVDNESASGAYYQIPTVSFAELPHGTYTVTIKVTTAAEGRSTYYLDGIRVYNPLSGEQEEDSTVSDAYKEEVGAAFIEVRDILLTNDSISQDANVAGAVFIDKTINNETGQITNEIGTYETYGPKNEVYLATGQSIAFALSGGDGVKYQIGLKAPTGESTLAEITNGSNKSEVNINAASDLYYTITPNDNGYVIITNIGSSLLSITKLKTIGDGGVETASVMSLLAYADEFDILETVAYEETEQEESEITEPSESTDQETKDEPGDVVIDNPEPEPEPAQPSLKEWFNKLFDSFRKWFK